MDITTLSPSSDLETAPLCSSLDRPSFSPLPISSPTSSPPSVVMEIVSKEYDVFLSFRGEDTRKNIMGHLRDAFSEKGIEVFVDDDRLERGQFISPQLLQAIENSSCSVVIPSPNYASSTWCLDELVKILDCMRTKGQIVIPIFYHVEPSDVRKQTGSFGEAIAKHEMCLTDNLERVNNWRLALTELTNLAGLDLKNFRRDEANLVREIVEEVSRKLSCRALSKTIQDDKHDQSTYSVPRRLLNSCLSIASPVIGVIAFFLFSFLVVFPLSILFFVKVLGPIFLHFVNDLMPPDTFSRW